MPGFNGSGTFVRTHNWVTDKANSVKVTASRMDSEDDGFATGLSTAICKDGQTTTTAAIPFAVGINISDGTAATPAIKFTNDTDCGWYRIGVNNVGLSIGGSLVWDYGTATASAAGSLVVGGTLAVTGGVTAATATVSVFAATGAATFASTVGVTGQLTAATATVSVFAATGAATFASTVGITGQLTAATATVSVFAATGAATFASTVGITGNVAVNTNKFNVTAASGNTTIAGTLGVTGATTVTSGGLTVTAGGLTVTDGGLTVSAGSVSLPFSIQRELFHVRDLQATTTAGQTWTGASWNTVRLNTSATNEISGASLAANQITLPAGTYWIDATALYAQADDSDRCKTRLRNTTDGSDAIVGLIGGAAVVTGGTGVTATGGAYPSFLRGRFTIAAQKTFEFQLYASTGTSNVAAVSDGTSEVYADVMIWKVA